MTQKNTKIYVLFAAIFLAFFLVGCTSSTEIEVGQDTVETFQDSVVVTVNGEEIMQSDVLAYKEAFTSQGLSIDESEVIEQIISQIVIEEEIQRRGIVVTEEEALLALEQELALQGISFDEFTEMIALSGDSLDEYISNFKLQIGFELFIDEFFETITVEVTDEEVAEVFELYSMSLNETDASIDDATRLEIEEFIRNQKQSEYLEAFISSLVNDAEVVFS